MSEWEIGAGEQESKVKRRKLQFALNNDISVTGSRIDFRRKRLRRRSFRVSNRHLIIYDDFVTNYRSGYLSYFLFDFPDNCIESLLFCSYWESFVGVWKLIFEKERNGGIYKRWHSFFKYERKLFFFNFCLLYLFLIFLFDFPDNCIESLLFCSYWESFVRVWKLIFEKKRNDGIYKQWHSFFKYERKLFFKFLFIIFISYFFVRFSE